jgi:putative lipoic acid-binding regulatory protein
MEDPSLLSLQAKLDEFHTWPCAYMFKFIAPMAKLDELTELFKGKAFTTRFSRTAKYVSITAEWEVESSTEVIAFYREAKKIKGVIAL